MRHSYVPLGIEHLPFVVAAHLPGVTAAVDGFSIGEVRISKLTWGECRLLEKSRFMADLQDVFVYGREPLFIVFAGYPVDEEAITRIKDSAEIAISRSTRALRLLKDGEVWDPLEFIRYERHNSFNSRDPGLFGRLGFNLGGDQFVTLTLEDITALDGLYNALQMFDHFRYDLTIDRAEALLGASFSPAHANHAHRMLPLVGAIEVLAGRDIYLLAQAEWADDQLRHWTDSFRSLRNTLAHGRKEDSKMLGEMLTTTRKVIRVLLREAIAWRLVDPTVLDVTGAPLLERVLGREAAGPERLANLHATYPSLRAVVPNQGT